MNGSAGRGHAHTVRATTVPAGTRRPRGSPSFFTCFLQGTCSSWTPVLEKYLVSSSSHVPFHFCVAPSAPQSLSAPKREDHHLALNALPHWRAVSCAVH